MDPVILKPMRSPKLEFMLTVDPKSPMSLQQQVRQRIVDAISHGTLRPGRRLPASRQLARQAGVSRNTITLAYDSLLAEGHLQSRPRSGIYVAPNVQLERVTTGRRGLRHAASIDSGSEAPREDGGFRVPPNWLQYPYPFIDGCIEPELISVAGWREALRLASSRQELLRWGTGAADLALLDPPYDDERGPRRHISVVTSPNERGVLGLCTRLRDTRLQALARGAAGRGRRRRGAAEGGFVLPEETDQPLRVHRRRHRDHGLSLACCGTSPRRGAAVPRHARLLEPRPRVDARSSTSCSNSSATTRTSGSSSR